MLPMRKPIYGSYINTINMTSCDVNIITDNTAYGVFGHVSSGQTVVDLIPCFTNMLVIIVHCDYILSFC